MNIIVDWNVVLLYVLLIKLSKLRWLDICQVVFFVCFMDQEEVIVQKTTNSHTEKTRAKYPAILTK